MLRFAFILLLGLTLTACGAGSPVQVGDLVSTPLASSDGNWTLKYGQSGGFAGINRTMEVRSDGQAVVTDARSGKSATIQLTESQLSELRRLIDTSVYQSDNKPSPCADCFVYTLNFETSNGVRLSAQMDDTNLEASGLSPLVAFLRGIMENALNS